MPESRGLTPRERAVLTVLEAERGRVISRADLSRRAGLGGLSARRVDTLLVGLRARFGDRLVTVRGRGWMLANPSPDENS